MPTILTADYSESPTFVKLATKPFSEYLTIQKQKYEKIDVNISKNPLFDRLYPFQRETLEFALERHGRILIGDEMGIGKSVQALACSLLFEEVFPLLIICPSSLKHVWKD